MKRWTVLAGLGGWLVLGGSMTAEAQWATPGCASVTLVQLRQAPTISSVFRGKVIEARPAPHGFLVTLLVDRVWKGDVQRETTLYQLMAWPMYPAGVLPRSPNLDLLAMQQAADALPFEIGQEYLASTNVRDLPQLKDVEPLKADVVVRGSASQCITMPTSHAAHVEQILASDPGYLPQ